MMTALVEPHEHPREEEMAAPRTKRTVPSMVTIQAFPCSIHPVSETFGSFSSRFTQKSLQINVKPGVHWFRRGL